MKNIVMNKRFHFTIENTITTIATTHYRIQSKWKSHSVERSGACPGSHKDRKQFVIKMMSLVPFEGGEVTKIKIYDHIDSPYKVDDSI